MYAYRAIVLAISIILLACSPQQFSLVRDENKAKGAFTVFSEYHVSVSRKRIRKEEQKMARTKCKSWGYKTAVLSPENTKECLEYNLSGTCIRWRVFQDYRCVR